MHVTYSPADGDRRRWTFDPGQVRVSKAEMIERRYGQPYDKWRADVQGGSISARRVLLWHLLTQDGLALRYEDTPDFLAAEVLIEHSAAELLAMREQVERLAIPETDRAVALSAIDADLAEAVAREAEAGELAPGKAPSESER